MCVSTHIAKIAKAFEIKLTIKSNLFKNGCLFIHIQSIQKKSRLKYIGRLPQIIQQKKLFFFN